MEQDCLNQQTIKEMEKLYGELSHEFHLQMTHVKFGEQSLELLKVADIDELLEGVTDADQIPFWADLWPASLGLTRYIFNNRHLLRERTVLELGAGIGLAGIAAKIAGANVLQTDYAEAALRFTRLNSLRNGLPEPRLLLADWRHFPQIGQFDLIIGADILYEKTLHPSLTELIANALKPDGVLWLADPGRDYALEFVLSLMEHGWQAKQLRVPVVYELRTHQIDIYQLHLGGNRTSQIAL